jgi:hypothetical protein
MQIKVQITVQSEQGEPEVIQEVARLERGTLRPDTLGLSLAEARAILAGLERAMAEQQTTGLLAQAQRCPQCGRPRPCKGPHRIDENAPSTPATPLVVGLDGCYVPPQANAGEPEGGLKSSWVKASPRRAARPSVSAL